MNFSSELVVQIKQKWGTRVETPQEATWADLLRSCSFPFGAKNQKSQKSLGISSAHGFIIDRKQYRELTFEIFDFWRQMGH